MHHNSAYLCLYGAVATLRQKSTLTLQVVSLRILGL